MDRPQSQQKWNDASHVLHTFLGVVINTTADHLGRNNLHLLLLQSSMIKLNLLTILRPR